MHLFSLVYGDSLFCICLMLSHIQWHHQDFVTGGSEIWVYSLGGLEYEVPQKPTHLLQCIGNL